MEIKITPNGVMCNETIIAESEWDFISQHLDCYSWDEQVSLSNDIAVVLEIVERGIDPYEYMSIPENERDYSDGAFNHVAEYITDLRDADALNQLIHETDGELFKRACSDYIKAHYE